MFKSLILATLLTVSVAHAAEYQHPSDSEIQQKRACFEDLEVQGCVKQEDDPAEFRACLSNVLDRLDESCQKVMLELYSD
jgi:hypothetical protein